MTSILSLGFAFAFVVAVQGWDYGLDHYHSAPHYHGQSQQYELSTCPPSGPEGLVCAGIPGSEPFTFPNACEVARFRAVTGKDWQIIHEGRCDNLEVCPGHCRNQYSPVCGKFKDERRNFNSECELQLVKCRTGDPWRKQHNGPCESRYPAGQSFRVQNYNPYAVNPYQSHQGYSVSQSTYGRQEAYGSHGPQAAYGYQAAYGSQGAYRSQPAYGPQAAYGSQGSYDSSRSFVPYGPYSPYAISSQSQPSFVSPPPPYKAPVYYPYEITWENLPTEFGIHGKSYENLPTEYPAPSSQANSYEKMPTEYGVTLKPYEEPTYEKPATYDSPTSDKPIYEKPAAYDSPTSDNPTYVKPAYESTTASTTSTSTASTTTTSTTEKTTAAPTTTSKPETTTQSPNPRQNIKVNAVVETPVTSTTASPTKAPVTTARAAPLEKYATTATPQHATTTPRTTFEKVIKINAVQEKSNSTTTSTTTTTTTTTKSPVISTTTHKATPAYGYQAKTYYKSSPNYTTTEPPKVMNTTEASFDKIIKINAVQEPTTVTEETTTEEETTEEPTTEEPTTEEPTTEEQTTYRSYPTYQAPSSYSSYPTSYKSHPSYGSYKTPPVYTTTEEPKVTERTTVSLDKIIKINAVQETTAATEEPTTSTTEEETTEEPTTEEPTTEEPTSSTTEESTTISTEEPTTYPTTYPTYPTYQAPSYPTYQAPSTNGTYPVYEEASYKESSPVTYEEKKTYPASSGDSPVIIKTVNGSTFTKMYVEVPGKQGAKKFSLETSSGDNKSQLQQVYFLTFN